MKRKFFSLLYFALLMTVFYECSSQNNDMSSKIVLINIDTLDRREIAKIVRKVNALNPKVLAIDVNFPNHKANDGDLVFALDDSKNLVMSSVIKNFNGMDVDYARFKNPTISEFLINAKTGFTNAILEDDEHGTLKRFSTYQRVLGQYEYHFAVQTALLFDNVRTSSFISENPRVIDVDYKNGQRKFRKFSAFDVQSGQLADENIEGKIVMLGALGPGNEDKFFTPLNASDEQPDMYGLEYLANIVAQILEYGNY